MFPMNLSLKTFQIHTRIFFFFFSFFSARDTQKKINSQPIRKGEKIVYDKLLPHETKQRWKWNGGKIFSELSCMSTNRHCIWPAILIHLINAVFLLSINLIEWKVSDLCFYVLLARLSLYKEISWVRNGVPNNTEII